MQRLWLLLAVLTLSLTGFAQTPDPAKIADLNKRAIDALVAKKYDEGIQLFTQLLELRPQDKGTAYNLACACSLKGDVDAGITWLDKACTWGWGGGQGQIYGDQKTVSEIDMCRQDADLANLRKDPRFEPLLAKMQLNVEKRKELQKKADAHAASAATYVPEALKTAAEVPLLVVVHDGGTTKDEIVSGFWKGVADELGFALVAPSGKFMAADEPAKGMAWFEDVNEYLDPNSSWKSEKPIHDAVSAFKKERKVDATRVVLVGDGSMGSLVAYGAGISSPGLYKVVVAVDGAFAPALIQPKLASAAKMGQKAAVLWDVRAAANASADEQAQLEAAVGVMQKSLADAGVGAVTKYTSDANDAGVRKKAVVELIKSLATGAAAKPVEAGAGK